MGRIINKLNKKDKGWETEFSFPSKSFLNIGKISWITGISAVWTEMPICHCPESGNCKFTRGKKNVNRHTSYPWDHFSYFFSCSSEENILADEFYRFHKFVLLRCIIFPFNFERYNYIVPLFYQKYKLWKKKIANFSIGLSS